MNSKYQKIVLFANGELPEPDNILRWINKEDFLIAVDGGLNHMTNLSLKPNLIIGDLDSVEEEKLDHFRKQNVKIEKYPVEKDQNDLELAIQAAVDMKPETIWIVAALGNRIDQTLANIFLLTREDLIDIDTHLVDGLYDVFIIRKEAVFTGIQGQLVSLIPILGPVKGISTEGLKYPLNNEPLYPDKTRGISNRLSSFHAKIKIKDGLLLCIHKLTNP
jgi:thiamine pyrophosphokinase